MRENLDPKFWGPNAWQFLQDCAVSVDDESYPSYQQLIALLPQVLPCENCRNHCDMYLRDHPLPPPSHLHDWLGNFQATVRARKDEENGTTPTVTGTIMTIILAIILLVGAVASLHYANF
jgi:hypothetical protein